MVNSVVRTIAAIVGGLVLLFASVGGTETARADSIVVRITGTLEPSSVTVAPGTSVTFENADGDRHRMRTTSGPDEFDTGNLDPGERFTVSLSAVGTYRYLDERDDENPSYVGQIVVSTAPPPTTPGAPPTTAPPAPNSVNVSIGDRIYAPATVTVAAGGTVTWVNNDDRPHTVTADDRSFDSGIMDTGDSWSRVFPNGGTFTYFCELHPDMRGSVSVDTGSGPPPTTPPPTVPPPTTSPAPPTTSPPPTTAPPATPGNPAPSAGHVTISANTFGPGTITIVAGGSVTWTNQDAVPHTATANDGSFDSGLLRQGDSWSRVFPNVGTFAYFCELHPEMTATVVVVAPGTPTPPTTAPAPTTAPTPTTSPPGSPPVTTTPIQTPVPTVPAGQPLPSSAAVSIAGNAYEPEVVTIAVGGSVTWTNLDQLPHTVTAEDRSFDSGILFTGDSWSMTFASPGTYRYFCELHPEMTATVVVTTAGAAPPAVVTGGSSTSGSSTGGSGGSASNGSSSSGTTTGSSGSGTTNGAGADGAVPSSTSSTSSTAPAAVAVSMGDNRFQPAGVTIGAGGTVTWTNTDTLPHTVTADDGSFDSGIMMPGDTFSWRFDDVGTVAYSCTLHQGMVGTVDVVAGSDTSLVESVARGTGVGGVSAPTATAAPLDGGDGAGAGDGVADIVVRITESEFPAVVTLAVGQTITWVNDDDRSVDVVADDGSFASGELRPGDRFSSVFPVDGAVSYRSTIRDGMDGMVVVVPGPPDSVEVVPTVAVYDAWFAPRELVVHQGDTVRWAFGGVLPHTVSAADGSFESGILEPGAIFEVAFTELGTFDYSCLVHPAMTATVTVVPVGEEIPDSRSGISAIDAGPDALAAARVAPPDPPEPAGTGIDGGVTALLILGLGFGVAVGILVGVGRPTRGPAPA